jgi:ElaB/YqjD/DUF883 family membrane-anchored ribosome-binding protein
MKAKTKKAIKKHIGVAKKKGRELQKVAAKSYAKAKRKTMTASGEFEKIARIEFAKIKREMDGTAKKVEAYVKKNPKEAAMISAGIGAALGAVAGLLASSGKKKKR